METLSFIFFFDAAACMMLAAASALRARHAASLPIGACFLGLLCGLLGPLLRAAFVGQAPLILNSTLYPAAALAGAILGALLGRFVWTEGRFFFLLDAAGLQLMACSGILVAQWWPLSSLGALLLAIFSALAPSLLRDLALGDTSAITDEPAYVTAPLLACLLTSVCLSLQCAPLLALGIGCFSGFLARLIGIRQ